VEESYTGRFLRPLLEAAAGRGPGEPGDWRRAA
jgi:hypothetical protein